MSTKKNKRIKAFLKKEQGKKKSVVKHMVAISLSICMVVGLLLGDLQIMNPVEVQAAGGSTLEDLMERYPEGTSSVPYHSYYGNQTCAAVAERFGHEMYGTRPHTWSLITNKEQIKAGDIVSWTGYTGYNGSWEEHWAMVIGVNGDTLTIGEGNYASKFHWGRTISKSKMNISKIYVAPGELKRRTAPTPSGYSPEGNLDSASGGIGSFTISGWAFDRDNSSVSIGIHVYIGNEFIAAFNADGIRTDVNDAFPGIGNNHGFEKTITTDKTGEQTLTVFAIDEKGSDSVKIGSCVVNIEPTYSPEGNLDYASGGVGSFTISGWAFDRNDSSLAVGIHVYIGNEFIAAFNADGIRTDVNDAFPGIGNNHGFEKIIKTDKTGEQTISVFAIDTEGGESVKIGSKIINIISNEVVGSTANPSPKPSEQPSESPSTQPSKTPSVSQDTFPTEQPNEERIKGDVNGDKKVTLIDAQMTLRVALAITQLDEESKKSADVDGKEGISLSDAQMILRAALAIIKL